MATVKTRKAATTREAAMENYANREYHLTLHAADLDAAGIECVADEYGVHFRATGPDVRDYEAFNNFADSMNLSDEDRDTLMRTADELALWRALKTSSRQ